MEARQPWGTSRSARFAPRPWPRGTELPQPERSGWRCSPAPQARSVAGRYRSPTTFLAPFRHSAEQVSIRRRLLNCQAAVLYMPPAPEQWGVDTWGPPSRRLKRRAGSSQKAEGRRLNEMRDEPKVEEW